MSKTFRTVGSGSTQTLESIENNKIPVYETKAAAEADIANLSDGQIIGTKDEGNENAKPVDVVEYGNLHAVTSNAVADSLSYSTQEVKTGGTWIDGKPIYRKVLTATLQTDEQVLTIEILPQLKSIASIRGTLTTSQNVDFPIPYCFVDGSNVNQVYVYCQGLNLIIIPRSTSGNYFKAGCTVRVIVEYTKTTD